jgi:hypothetical protein
MTSATCRWLLGLVLLIAPAAAADEISPPADPEAERMMKAAHAARSGWGASFPGMQAQAVAVIDGQRAEGAVTIGADGAVAWEGGGGPARDWAVEQLESIAMHRSAGVRDAYDVSFADDVADHPLGRLIRFHGGATHSLYRIKDDVITEVHRRMDGVRFTISVTDVTRNAEGQTLPRHFNVSYWDAETGELTSNDDFQDEWARVGAFDLPSRRLLIRTAKDKREVAELRLSAHALLSREAASP